MFNAGLSKRFLKATTALAMYGIQQTCYGLLATVKLKWFNCNANFQSVLRLMIMRMFFKYNIFVVDQKTYSLLFVLGYIPVCGFVEFTMDMGRQGTTSGRGLSSYQKGPSHSSGYGHTNTPYADY